MVILNTVRLDDYTINKINSNHRFFNQLALAIGKVPGYGARLQQQLNDITYNNEKNQFWMELDELDQW